jgi:hypothetical protein
MLAEISQREGEGGGHAQPLGHAQKGKDREAGQRRKQGGRDGEQDEADEDAFSPVDLAAEIADQPGHRHAHGAGVDGKTHLKRG